MDVNWQDSNVKGTECTSSGDCALRNAACADVNGNVYYGGTCSPCNVTKIGDFIGRLPKEYYDEVLLADGSTITVPGIKKGDTAVTNLILAGYAIARLPE